MFANIVIPAIIVDQAKAPIFWGKDYFQLSIVANIDLLPTYIMKI